MENTSVEEREFQALLLGGETLRTEFKDDSRDFADGQLVEAVVCMANCEGGVLLVGVDNRGNVTGISRRRIDESDAAVSAMVFNNTVPPLRVAVARLSSGSRTVLLVEIPKATRGIVATATGKVTRRVMGARGPECVPYPPTQHASRLTDLGLLDYSASPLTECSLDAVDPLAIEFFRQAIRASRPAWADLPLDELLSAAGLTAWLDSEHKCLSVGGLLTVGSTEIIARLIPTHEVAFQAFDESDNLVANEFFRLPLMRVIGELERRFEARNGHVEVEVGLFQVQVDDYPKPSFREGLLNALIHRDYSRQGAVYVQMHHDRMTIMSPGGFPGGVTLENLLVHEPAPRNPTLANAFLQLGLVERSGRGIDRIFFHQLRSGRPAPDYGQSDPDAVRLILPGGQPSLAFVRLALEEERRGQALSGGELLVLNHLEQNRRMTAGQASQLLQRGEAAARSLIARLVERGFVTPARRRGEFELSPAIYRMQGKQAAFVRSHGFDPIQQRGMIIEYVKAHEKITRREAADLCRLESSEAKRLLASMKTKGILKIEGERRSARYIAGPSFWK